jgi:hypothetical protein
MTRLFPENTPCSVVATQDGEPVKIQILGGWHDVEFIANKWRENSSWWDKEIAVNRELYKVATTDGILCIVYRNLNTDVWCIQRIYD